MDAVTLSPAQVAAARTLLVDRVTSEVMEALRAAGVGALLMKGPVFADLLFDPAEVRAYRDTDVLVSPDAGERASAVLRELGFSTLPTAAIAAKQAQLWVRGSDEVDLHREMWGALRPPDEVWETLSRGARMFTLRGREMPAYSRVAALAHVALHAAQHMRTDVKVLEDLERGIARAGVGEWRLASDVAAEIGALEAFAAGLRRVPAGEALAQELALAERLPVEVLLVRERRPGTIRYLHRLRRTPGLRAKAAMLPGALLPSPEWMRTKPLARRGRRGLAAAYALRLARGGARLVPSLLALRRMGRTGR